MINMALWTAAAKDFMALPVLLQTEVRTLERQLVQAYNQTGHIGKAIQAADPQA
jgi:hypothetical protein